MLESTHRRWMTPLRLCSRRVGAGDPESVSLPAYPEHGAGRRLQGDAVSFMTTRWTHRYYGQSRACRRARGASHPGAEDRASVKRSESAQHRLGQPLISNRLATPIYVDLLDLPLRVLWSDARGVGLDPCQIEYRCDLRRYGPRPNTLKMIELNPLAARLGAADLLPGAFGRAMPAIHRRVALAHETGSSLYDGQIVICTAAYELGPRKIGLDIARASYLGRMIVLNDRDGLKTLRAAVDGIPPSMALPSLGIASCLFTGDRKLILTRRSRSVEAASSLRSISAAGGIPPDNFGAPIPYLHRTAIHEIAGELSSALSEQLTPDDVRVRALFVNSGNLQVGAIGDVTTRLSSAAILAGSADDAHEVDEREAVDCHSNVPKLIDRLISERDDWEPMSLFGALLCLGARNGPRQVEELVVKSLAAHPNAPAH
jgi:hypothetical protein